MAIKQGPWGGNRGSEWDMGVVDHISKVQIYYTDVIVGLKITYTLNNKTDIFSVGEVSNVAHKELNLQAGEYITTISGSYQFKWNENVIITQLTLQTDKGNKIETLNTNGSSFDLNLGGELSKVVGFFGKSDTNSIAIVGIGVYAA